MLRKTQATQIQVGDVIDFDAHTGVHAVYNGRPDDYDVIDWHDQNTAFGKHKVIDVERVMAPVLSGMRRRYSTAIRIYLDNGRDFDTRGTGKFPVVTDEEA